MKKRLIQIMMFVSFTMLVFYGCSKPKDKEAGASDQTISNDEKNQEKDQLDAISDTPTENDVNTSEPKDENTSTNPEEINETPSEEITETPVEDTTTTEDSLYDVEKEDILFRFQVKNSNKYVTVSFEKSAQDYLVYRYGTKENVELTFPETVDKGWNQFTYSYYMRGGGVENEAMDLNYLEFKNGGYLYKVYEEYVAGGETVVGIIVTNMETSEETIIEGDATTIEGTLINLRDNDRIKIEQI